MKRKLNYSQIFKILLLVSIGCFLILFLQHIDFKALWQLLAQIGWRFSFLIAITGFAYMLGSLGWLFCFPPRRNRPSLGRLFIVRQITEMVSTFNPTHIIAGDILKAKLLKDKDMPLVDIRNSVVIARLNTILSQLFLLALTVGYLVFQSPLTDQVFLSILLLFILLILVVSIYFLVKKKPMEIQVYTGTKYLQKIKFKCLEMYIQGSAFYREHPVSCGISFSCFLAHWIIGASELYYIFILLQLSIPLIDAIWLDMGITVLKSVGGFIPGQLGVEELANRLLLASLGISSTFIWIGVSLLRRARQLFWLVFASISYPLFKP